MAALLKPRLLLSLFLGTAILIVIPERLLWVPGWLLHWLLLLLVHETLLQCMLPLPAVLATSVFLV